MDKDRSLLANRERDLFLYRIIEDELWYKNKVKLLIKSPSPKILLRAQEIYNNVYDKCEQTTVYSDDDILGMLIEDGLWTEDDDFTFDLLPKKIDGFKLNLFENIRRPILQKQIKKHLEQAKAEYSALFNKRHKLDYLSISGIANFAKHQYIISRCTFKRNKIWKWESESMYSVLDFYYKNIISDQTIRHICRTQPWMSMWSSKKPCGGLFGKPSTQLTPDQNRLVYWSQVYENAYQQQDHDPNTLVQDDDVFDGWLLYRDRENKSDQAEKFIQNQKIANSQEIFVNANDPMVGTNVRDQAREVSNLNNARARNIKRNRFNTLDKEGTVAHHQFKDVKDRKYER